MLSTAAKPRGMEVSMGTEAHILHSIEAQHVQVCLPGKDDTEGADVPCKYPSIPLTLRCISASSGGGDLHGVEV